MEYHSITHHSFNITNEEVKHQLNGRQALGAARPATGNGISSSGCAVCWTTEARQHGFRLLFLVEQMFFFWESGIFLKGKLILSQLFTHIYIYIYICLIYIHVISYIYHHILDIIYVYIYTSCTFLYMV